MNPAKTILHSLLLLTLLLTGCSKPTPADLLIYGGSIYTHPDSAAVEALIIHEGKVLAYGSETAMRQQFVATDELNLDGATALPGFLDAHSHFLGLARFFLEVDLMGAQSEEEAINRIATWANQYPEGWIIGRGWDQNLWNTKTYPTAEKLNALFPDRPIYLVRVDGHAAWVNQALIKALQLNPNAPVAGGEILNHGAIWVDGAKDLITPPRPDSTLLLNALRQAEAFCFSLGLTGVADCGLEPADLVYLHAAYQQKLLSLPVYAMASDDSASYSYLLEHAPVATNGFTLRCMKMYADGALGSRGALLLEPYQDREGHFGLPVRDLAFMEKRARQMKNAGLQLAVHAIGDSANRNVLNTLARYAEPNLRWRIEHAQVTHPDDRQVFGSAKILPSVQPTHATSDAPWVPARLGDHRLNRAYAYKSLLDVAGVLPLGTDFPVEHPDPLRTFYSAVFREPLANQTQGKFMAQEALSREEALKGMTLWAAYAQFEENKKGLLGLGYEANITVLTKNPLTTTQEELQQNEVKFTILGGQVVYKKP